MPIKHSMRYMVGFSPLRRKAGYLFGGRVIPEQIYTDSLVKPGWEESASIYAAVIADTGSMKSPALGKVMQPMVEVQTAERRTWTSDTTTEKLVELHQNNPHGIAIVRDELLGWVKSCNQYRDGKGGDRENYLSAWSGMDLVVDRKSNEAPLTVKNPFLSVLGCLPPDRLAELEGDVPPKT